MGLASSPQRLGDSPLHAIQAMAWTRVRFGLAHEQNRAKHRGASRPIVGTTAWWRSCRTSRTAASPITVVILPDRGVAADRRLHGLVVILPDQGVAADRRHYGLVVILPALPRPIVARDKRIFDLWLACWTQEEIAEECGCDRATVDHVLRETADLPKSAKPAAEHATDFLIPIYNVWKQQEKTAGSNHFGNSEVRWLDNLLYLYTEPLSIVVDPFAGGGSTIDLCRKRFRRYWVGDRKPVCC